MVFKREFVFFKLVWCLWLCSYLFPTKAKNSKRKTPVMKKSLNPHYNETFVYKELTLEQLKEMCLELTVWDKESLHSNEFLGGVRLSSGEGKWSNLWSPGVVFFTWLLKLICEMDCFFLGGGDKLDYFFLCCCLQQVE